MPSTRHRDPQASAHAHALPPELLAKIISFLEPANDKATLRSLLFVSQTVGAIAIKPLYARLKLDETHFAQLVNGGRDDPLRQQRFSLIHHLELCPPPSAETMATVYQAVGDQGDPAVFPNVKTLRLEHRDHWKEEDDAFLERRDKGDGPPGLPPKGLVLFDSPDVCIRGRFFAVEALEYLPSRSVSNSTLIVHTAFLEAIHRSTIPRGWRQLVVYYTDINGIMYSDEQREFATMSKPAEGYSQEPMLIYCPNDDHHEGSLANSLWAMQRHWPYWDPSTAQCLVFDDDAPPCSICGCRWEDFWDEADEEHKPKRIGDLLPTPSEPTKQSVGEGVFGYELKRIRRGEEEQRRREEELRRVGEERRRVKDERRRAEESSRA